MAPLNGDPAAASHAARARRAPIVPAIPLALSKPKVKPAKPQFDTDMSILPIEQETSVNSALNGTKEKEASKTAPVTEDLEAMTQAELPTNGEGELVSQDITPAVDMPASENSSNISVFDGSTPVPVENTAEQALAVTDGPVDTSSPTITASPLSARRDRFDIRHIRTELPPAFVPFAEQTPHSAHSTASSHGRPYQQLPHAHPVHPSASSIVFGGQDSSTSSPAPPLSAASAFAPPHFPPQGNHAHHASESQVQRAPYPQPPVPWVMRPYGASGPPLNYHPHAHVPFRYPPREPFAPGAPVPIGSGPRSRSGSRASSGPHDAQRQGNDLRSPLGSDQADGARIANPEQRSTAFPPQHRHIPSQHMHPPPPAFPPPDIASAIENAGAMRDYVLSQFLKPGLADCHLQIVEAETGGRTYIDGHKVLLARSPKLLALIRNSDGPQGPHFKAQVRVELNGRYSRIDQFYESVRYLYGGPLPRFDFYRTLGSNGERMNFALCFIAMGAWLGIPAIAHQSVEIATSFLQWDTFPAALALALDGGLDPVWPIGDGSEERVSTCSSEDSFSKPEAGGAPTYDPYSTGLLHRIVEFTVQNLPPSFYLDQTAAQLAECPRLPAFRMKHESKASRSDPRLSKIRFGEIPVPVDEHQRPSPTTTSISSILLSLPFPLLKYLLKHPLLSSRLGPETVGSIMRQVVQEREVRRTKVLQSRTMGKEGDAAGIQQIQNLYWEEVVEQSAQHRAGFRLARRRRGIDTPPSSGTESERVQ